MLQRLWRGYTKLIDEKETNKTDNCSPDELKTKIVSNSTKNRFAVIRSIHQRTLVSIGVL